MSVRSEHWLSFLAIDGDTLDALAAFSALLPPHMDGIMEAVYARIAVNPQAAALFPSADSMARARERQKRHWLEHVFAGRFDEAYLAATRAIGETHYRLGVDMLYYVGAYSVVLGELTALVPRLLPDDAVRQQQVLEALNRAIFLDMGLATSVYYDMQVGAVEEMSNELNFSLARAGEFRDNETGRHLMRMSRMCHALALALGRDAKWATMLKIASPLHDVGKIGIPDAVLLKPGRLDAEEMEVMRAHPAIGGRIIPDHPAEVIRMARRISLTHHERWDGSGYPAGLMGEEIPLEGRIAAICDVYDALASARPYKQPWPQERIIAHLRENSGRHFDPALVERFLAILPQIDEIQRIYADRDEAAGTAVPSTGTG